MTHRRHLLSLAAAVAVAASLMPGAPAAAAEPYACPVRPGDAKWATFATHQEMEKATQLPDKQVKNMSTARSTIRC